MSMVAWTILETCTQYCITVAGMDTEPLLLTGNGGMTLTANHASQVAWDCLIDIYFQQIFLFF